MFIMKMNCFYLEENCCWYASTLLFSDFLPSYFTKLFYSSRKLNCIELMNNSYNSTHLLNHVHLFATRCRTISNNRIWSNWHDSSCVPERGNRILSLPIIIKVLRAHWSHVVHLQNSTSPKLNDKIVLSSIDD